VARGKAEKEIKPPPHSLSNPELEIQRVSISYNLDPDIVEGWSYPKFADRQEGMWIRDEIERRRHLDG